ncbi:segregation protein A [Clostridiales bacterium PH28_bin88]|nr:segregation protein A [Clostridiales bacterium PH28_bin88]
MGPGTLTEILATLPTFQHPDLLISGSKLDDAGVYRLTPELALVQTVDFFTPMVDDPYVFGQVAAANALSDVYAMGGKPLTVMNIIAFPTCSMDLGILRDILAGGADKILEAGALLVGGHTIEDNEPKYGLSVTGIVHPDKVIANEGARPGDVMVLTKPLGVGIITTGLKGGLYSPEAAGPAVESMVTLNARAAEAMIEVGVHAATDVTGFGFLGHAYEVCAASGVGLEVTLSQVPVLEGAWDLARMGVVPGGAKRNRQYLAGKVRWEGDIPEEAQDILCDPQTSGGLLMAVPAERLGKLSATLDRKGILAAVVGQVSDEPGVIVVKGG